MYFYIKFKFQYVWNRWILFLTIFFLFPLTSLNFLWNDISYLKNYHHRLLMPFLPGSQAFSVTLASSFTGSSWVPAESVKAFDGVIILPVIVIITVELPFEEKRGHPSFVRFIHELYHYSNKIHCLLANHKGFGPLENVTTRTYIVIVHS